MAQGKASKAEAARGLDSIRPHKKVEGASPWTGVSHDSIANCVLSVTARGDALLLGTTSDGGAMTLLVLSGTTKRRFYESDCEEMTALLDELTEWAKYA